MSLALKTTEWNLANTTDLHDSWLLIFLIFSVFIFRLRWEFLSVRVLRWSHCTEVMCLDAEEEAGALVLADGLSQHAKRVGALR